MTSQFPIKLLRLLKILWLLPCTFLDHSLWGKPAATCKETQAVLHKGPHQEGPKPPAYDQHQLTHCTEEEIEAKRMFSRFSISQQKENIRERKKERKKIRERTKESILRFEFQIA
ncbi:uncharacterized protein LOC125093586 isoform X2 [Lutra lutra]|uniref:uncharacterized protein LOC125093586 isoform X2 n=1 Tax=Lutra lutra TaxID=9657 RepID=UPI001FD35062|nr:uncharacterized protein LOC125093586 isoform X2 [Lutra lutra]